MLLAKEVDGFQIVKDPSPFFDCIRDCMEVIICQNHIGCLLAYFTSFDPHSDPDICFFKAGASLTPSPVIPTISPLFVERSQFVACALASSEQNIHVIDLLCQLLIGHLVDI